MFEEKQKQFSQINSKKNTYKFNLGGANNPVIIISSNFDSGNIQLIKQLSQFYYRLTAVSDFNNQFKPKKTWFYFRIIAPKFSRIKLIIQNVDILIPFYQCQPQYKVVYRIGQNGAWKRLQECYLSYREELQLYIDYAFQQQETVYFALTEPFTYKQNNQYLNQIQSKITDQIYFKKQLLVYSPNQLQIHLLTITQNQDIQNKIYQDKINQNIFPQNNRPIKFNKPVILITARVHPGQVTSSYTLQGIISFLLNPTDLRSYILRKLFLFNIIPMVNPDGVYQGNYRMDPSNVNLNRMYNNPSYQNQPSIYAIKCLAEYLNNQQRIQFYFDLHGHSSKKGAFIYGNANDNFISQVQSQIFCKVLALNSRFFSYQMCNFSQKHMTIKDKNQPLTKQGCSRVVIGKMSGIIHCFTVQTGIHHHDQINILPNLSNQDLTYKQKGINKLKEQNFEFKQIFHEIGQGLLISVLDIIQKNPYSRIINSQYQSIDNMRKLQGPIVFQQQQRFKLLDLKAYQKSKSSAKLIKQYFLQRMIKKWSYLINDKLFINKFWTSEEQKYLKDIKQNPEPKKSIKPKKISSFIQNDLLQNNKKNCLSSQKKGWAEQFSQRNRTECESPDQKNLVIQNTLPKVLYRMTLKLDNSAIDFIKKSNFSKNKSTRKLLRDFKNQKMKLQNNLIKNQQNKNPVKDSVETLIITEQFYNNINNNNSNNINTIFPLQNKKKMQNKILNKSVSKNLGHNFKTQASQLMNPFVLSSGKVLKKQLLVTEIEEYQKDIKNENKDEGIEKVKKRSQTNKRQLITTKYNDLRKRIQRNVLIKLPQITKLRKTAKVDFEQVFNTKQLLIESIKINKSKI